MTDISSLETYLVGGAVRDELLGREVRDRDWVVVGSTAEQMLELGFTRVGRDFPVFLHPQTHEEYALARTERKQGHGHRGFVVDAAASVTLEEDLERRDLTVNAIAVAADGNITDPFSGVDDLGAKILRHVSPAFSEDPLRVFRVARFAAQFPDFSVADETMALMRQMAAAGELRELSAERVWQEFEKALAAPAPEHFFSVLNDAECLHDWFVEVSPAAVKFTVLDGLLRYAQLPLDEASFEVLSARLKVPGRYLQTAQDWQRWQTVLNTWREAPAEDVHAVFKALQVAHDPLRLTRMMGLLQLDESESEDLLALADNWRQTKVQDTNLQGPAFGAALSAARISCINDAR